MELIPSQSCTVVGSVLVFSRLFNHADFLSGACLICRDIDIYRYIYI